MERAMPLIRRLLCPCLLGLALLALATPRATAHGGQYKGPGPADGSGGQATPGGGGSGAQQAGPSTSSTGGSGALVGVAAVACGERRTLMCLCEHQLLLLDDLL